MGKSDCLADINEVHVCTETTHKEQSTIRLRHMNGGPNDCRCQPRSQFAEAEGKSNVEWWQYKEDRLKAMRDQIEDLTTQVSDWCHDNGNGSRNLFTERQMQGCQHLAQTHANQRVSRFKFDTPEFQIFLQPKEFMVAEKNRKFSQKKYQGIWRRWCLWRERSSSINQCPDTLEVYANNFNIHASWEARWPSLSSIQ
jgi:hypothetical protein